MNRNAPIIKIAITGAIGAVITNTILKHLGK